MEQPFITQSEFASRREKLMQQLPDSSAVVVPSASMVGRNNDVEYAFRQDSDFYYLTGFDEPDALVLMLKKEAQVSYILFCMPRDREMEIWNGYRHGPEGAVADFQANDAYSNTEIDTKVPELLDGIQSVYFCMGAATDPESLVHDWLGSMRKKRRQGVQVPETLQDLSPVLHEMRLIKSAAEIELMKMAGQLSAEGHISAMENCRPGMSEYQLEAHILFRFSNRGARQPAYSTIVGGGKNACVLHYISNRDELIDGDLVLIDAGCELNYYAGDITRTFPVNGRFTKAQKAIYELVLKAQEACIDMVGPGIQWDAPHDLSVRILTEGLVELGLLSGAVDDLISTGAYKDFYMHRVGHWLGMDVHDVGSYRLNGQARPLEPGMVMTVEPGIYISPDNHRVDPEWRGIGVRIEDDVLITQDGCEVLTSGVPKKVNEIEALMAKANH